MDAPLILSKTDEIKKIILLAMSGAGVPQKQAEMQLRAITPMVEQVLIGDAPMGVSPWANYGRKFGYLEYFENEILKQDRECDTCGAFTTTHLVDHLEEL